MCKIKFYFLAGIIGIASTNAHAQRDTVKSYYQIEYEIDSLLNTTRSAIDKDDNSNTGKLGPEIRKLNETNCKKIRNLLGELNARLHNEYGAIPEVMYQVEPFLVSLDKCTDALQTLTFHPNIYEEADRNAYESAFLFKELAKGNLFRALNSYREKPLLFEFAGFIGYQTNPMYNTLSDAYSTTEWRSEDGTSGDFENQNKSRNLIFKINLNYKIAKKAVMGMSFQSLPSGEIHTLIPSFQINLPDQATESFSGNSFHLNGYYLLINGNKYSKKGAQVKAGLTLCLNNFYLTRELSTWSSEYDHNEIVYNPETEVYDTIYYYNRYETTMKQENKFHSVSFGLNLKADYFLGTRISVNAEVSQYFDTGINVQQMDFNNRSLPSYTLKFNSFEALLGMGLHF